MTYEYCRFGKLQYLIRYPNGYEEGRKYPVLLFLHGAGSRSTDPDRLRQNAFFRVTDAYDWFPFVSVAPLCPRDCWFDLFETLEEFTDAMFRAPFTDRERFYLMGGSMGGYTAWQLAMSMPTYFAALIPICGGGMYWNAARLVSIPVWAFHGAKDTSVYPEESRWMVDRINAKGGNARLTVYPENAHDAWTDTYRNREVFDWLLSHRREAETDESKPADA